MTKNFAGIVIPTHRVIDAESKDKAQNTFAGWQLESLTAPEWMQRLSQGQTIQPSAFSPKSDGTFTHAKEYWSGTHFVCADADNIKGVETLSDGSEKNPDGIEAFIEQDGLSRRYPTLSDKVYAVGQSVSSMLSKPLHRRYRLIFLFDKPITTEAHYHQILLTLADEFPIIPTIERSPAQPVFGNAREGFGVHECGNLLSLDDYPYTPPVESKDESQPRLEFDETLEEYLRRHGIEYTHTKEAGKFYVNCPYKDHHTGGKHGKTDAFVFDDGKAWAYYCSHASCANNRTWDAFKEGNGIANRSGKPKPDKATVSDTVEESPFFDGKRFLPMGMVRYLQDNGTHVISLRHEDFVRVYKDGIYLQEQGEILDAMTTALGERAFKMTQYNEVIDYLQKRITRPNECQHDGYLNVANGFLKIDDLTLEDHSPDRKSIIQLPVTFDWEAEAKLIDAWLKDCLNGDAEQETLFYEAVGYSLLQTTEIQKMFFLLGRTQTGKSTAMHIVKALLGGDNFSAVELAPLEDETNRFARAQLYGKIVNFSCDISPKYLTGDGNVKKIIAGDPISGEYKFRPAFTFEPDCTLWAMANALPGSGDKSGAWYQKMTILLFEKQFLSTGENKPDRNLKYTLTADNELSGLLNIALLCGKRALERGDFTHSKRGHEVIEEYKILNDHVLQFISDLGDFTQYDDREFYDTYKDWCISENVKPMGKAKLANSTARHGIRRIRKKVDGDRYFVWENTEKV